MKKKIKKKEKRNKAGEIVSGALQGAAIFAAIYGLGGGFSK